MSRMCKLRFLENRITRISGHTDIVDIVFSSVPRMNVKIWCSDEYSLMKCAVWSDSKSHGHFISLPQAMGSC